MVKKKAPTEANALGRDRILLGVMEGPPWADIGAPQSLERISLKFGSYASEARLSCCMKGKKRMAS